MIGSNTGLTSTMMNMAMSALPKDNLMGSLVRDAGAQKMAEQYGVGLGCVGFEGGKLKLEHVHLNGALGDTGLKNGHADEVAFNLNNLSVETRGLGADHASVNGKSVDGAQADSLSLSLQNLTSQAHGLHADHVDANGNQADHVSADNAFLNLGKGRWTASSIKAGSANFNGQHEADVKVKLATGDTRGNARLSEFSSRGLDLGLVEFRKKAGEVLVGDGQTEVNQAGLGMNLGSWFG